MSFELVTHAKTVKMEFTGGDFDMYPSNNFELSDIEQVIKNLQKILDNPQDFGFKKEKK